MMAMDRLARLGFDPGRFGFALRTALAACLALALAWALGLEHPQWAGMTVWAASQPTRGLLVEKSGYRLLGTIVGVLFGMALVHLAGGRLPILVTGLSLWIALCAGLGNVARGLSSYGVVLSGYSASMVTLLDTAHPDQIGALGLDRFLTVTVGVALALAVGLAFTPRGAEGEMTGRTRRLMARTLRALESQARTGVPPSSDDKVALLVEAAVLEDGLDAHGAGSPRARRMARVLRHEVMAIVQAVSWLDRTGATAPNAPLAEGLNAIARALEGAAPREDAAALFADVAGDRAEGRAAVLGRLAAVLATPLGKGDEAEGRPSGPFPSLVPHRDWVGARHAALRALVVMALIGLFWVVTGWRAAPFLLLGASVMISLFSTFPSPAVIMRSVSAGQLTGVAGALACHWLVWPLATGEGQMIALLLPFVLIGGFAAAHRRTIPWSMDYSMILLLLSRPEFPIPGTVLGALENAVAVVLAPLVALVAYQVIYPVDAARRRDRMAEAMVRDLEAMAASDHALDRRIQWRERFAHRLLGLVLWSSRSPGQVGEGVARGLAVARVGEAILDLRDARRTAESPSETRAMDTVLRRLGRLGRDPGRARRSLDRLARRSGARPWKRVAEDIESLVKP
jgi:uncharacterized membrane protein YccC